MERKALRSADEYSVGWIAALPIERAAATAILDERHDQPLDFKQHRSDHNSYSWGCLSGHNVVIASLSPQYGTISAARAASNMLSSLPQIKFGLLVGIGAGIPNSQQDIRLGDIVVSQAQGTNTGVVQYDLGKAMYGGDWELKGVSSPPVEILSRAVTHLQSEILLSGSQVSGFLEEAFERYPKWASTSKHPGVHQDRLFKSSSIHKDPDNESCSACNPAEQIERQERHSTEPKVHYGTIGSGNTLVKDAHHREEIARRLGSNCLCLEMEAAGVVSVLPCIVIRGICDYADTHKNDKWQPYAAAVAAAYGKELLMYTPVHEVDIAQTAHKLLSDVRMELAQIKNTVQHSKASRHDSRVSRLLRALYTCPYEERKDRNPNRVEGTCNWFTQHPLFLKWSTSRTATLLWASANPGCGKSVLSRYLIDEVFETLYDASEMTVCYFFFKDDVAGQKSSADALCAILRQLLIQKPEAITEKLLARIARDGQTFVESFKSLWGAFIETSRDPKAGDILCVLDGLDECSLADCGRLVEAICALYTNTNQYSRIRFLITSRPYSYIQDAFKKFEAEIPTIHLGGENEDEAGIISQEIDRVIGYRVQLLCNLRGLDTEERTLLLNKFTEVTHRTYLWAHLTLSLFEETLGLTKEKIMDLLKDLPTTVEEAYEKILSTRVEHSRARLAFQVMIASTRPLKLEELSLILAIGDQHSSWCELSGAIEPARRFKNTIRNLCGLFIVVVKDQVFFLHQTARDFLLKKQSSESATTHQDIASTEITDTGCSTMRWKGSLSILDCHRILAERCLWYLHVLFAENTGWTAYCMQNWHVHFRSSNIDGRASEMKLAVDMCRGWDAGGFHVSALRKAARFGLTSVVDRLLDVKFRKKYTAKEKSEALWSAVHSNFEEAARLLLRNGADPNTNRDGEVLLPGDRPLHLATRSKNKTLMAMLLTKNVDIQARDQNGDTVLHIAATEFDAEIVSLLVRSGAMRYGENQTGSTPLQIFYKTHQIRGPCSSKTMAEHVFELLHGQRSGRTMADSLFDVVEALCVHCVEVLLRNGLSVSARNRKGNTLLHHAARLDSVPMIETALANGLSVDCRSLIDHTPLMTAVMSGSLNAVEWLLKAGADPNDHTLLNGPILARAIKNGDVDVARLLIDAGADVNARYRLLVPLLIKAINRRGGNKYAVIQTLLAAGANPCSVDWRGLDCLHHAISVWDPELVKVFLNAGCDANGVDGTEITPLMHLLRILELRSRNLEASQHSRLAILDQLLQHGATISQKDMFGKTALQYCKEKADANSPSDRHGYRACLEVLQQASQSTKQLTYHSLDSPASPEEG